MLVGGYTLDEARVPEKPTVLDVGCRADFRFSHAVLKRWPQARIIALDPAETVSVPSSQQISLFRQALVAGETGFTHLNGKPVYCMPIKRLMYVFGVAHWDIVKLSGKNIDEIAANWPAEVATQLVYDY